MDFTKVLAQLRAELENLNVAIASLERLATAAPRPSLDASTGNKRAAAPKAGGHSRRRSAEEAQH